MPCTAHPMRRTLAPAAALALALSLLLLAACSPAAAARAPRRALRQTNGSGGESSGPLVLKPLPYAYDALEPVISSKIMMLHHDTHEAGYVMRANAALKDLGVTGDKVSLGALLTQIGTGSLPPGPELQLRNQGGGHWNHQLYWKVMAPPGSPNTSRASITPALQSAIESGFGSVDAMLDALRAAANGVFGSGWAWVCVGASDGRLRMLTSPNQDNPLMPVASRERCIPILGLDVWEHAYYLQYGPTRADYTAAWVGIINWGAVSTFNDAASRADTGFNV